jgi:regulator of replication initiation timing
MNSILNNTIDKLKKRQAWIAWQKSQKTTTIDDLEAKIKDLREKVAYLKKEIVFLDDENIKIDINIWNLESMKTWKTIKTPSKTREHNTKKLTKQIKSV